MEKRTTYHECRAGERRAPDHTIIAFPGKSEVKLVARANPRDPIGVVDVEIGLGRGSRGPGRPLDHRQVIDTARMMALHLSAWATAYEVEARADGTL